MITKPDSVLALRVKEAAAAIGISPRLLWELTKDGKVPCIRLGTGRRKLTLYSVDALKAWLSQQAAQQATEPEGGEQ
jgi:excisionase family DNA binding protein